MSAFETTAWGWHCENVNDFVFKGGLLPMLVSDFVRDMKWCGKVRAMFLRGMGMIDRVSDKIAIAKAKDARAAEKQQNG